MGLDEFKVVNRLKRKARKEFKTKMKKGHEKRKKKKRDDDWLYNIMSPLKVQINYLINFILLNLICF